MTTAYVEISCDFISSKIQITESITRQSKSIAAFHPPGKRYCTLSGHGAANKEEATANVEDVWYLVPYMIVTFHAGGETSAPVQLRFAIRGPTVVVEELWTLKLVCT